MRGLEIVSLRDEEWEAILLADYKGLSHVEAAASMGVSRPTYSRMLAEGRSAVARALVEGAALKIGGGDFTPIPEEQQTGPGPGEEKMKIAISTTGDDLDAPMEERFGRAPKFLIYDPAEKSFIVIDNQTNDAPQGAGLKAAEAIVRAGAKVVVTGNCGPKAFGALTQAGVKVYLGDAETVQQAVDHFYAGKLFALNPS